MGIKGTISFWFNDIIKTKNNLNNIWLEVQKSDLPDLTKNKVEVYINNVFRLLDKGKEKTHGIVVSGKFYNMNEVFNEMELHRIYHVFLRRKKNEVIGESSE